jgi:hypothetical protein
VRTLLVSLLTIALFSGCTYNQQKHFDELFTAKKNGFDALRDAWIVEQSLSHPSQEFSLLLQPVDPLVVNQGTFSLQILRADHLPLQERFIFAAIDSTNEKIEARFEFEVLEDGKIKIFDQKGTRFENEIPFVACEGLIVGKPVTYAIVSKQSYTIASVEFNPYPIEAISEDGAKVSLIVSHPMLTRFQLQADHFQPEEKVKIVIESDQLREEVDMFANTSGSFSFGINPTVIGRLGGKAHLTVIREQEKWAFDFPWGSQLEKKTFEERSQFPILFVVNRGVEAISSEKARESFAATFFKTQSNQKG